ncbi:hypothetical protein L195_g020456, partial [Trifolium pratense]
SFRRPLPRCPVVGCLVIDVAMRNFLPLVF